MERTSFFQETIGSYVHHGAPDYYVLFSVLDKYVYICFLFLLLLL